MAGVRNKLLRGHTLGMVTRHWPDRGTGCKYIKIMPSVLQQLVTAHFRLPKSVTDEKICSMFTLLISVLGWGYRDTDSCSCHLTMCAEEELLRW